MTEYERLPSGWDRVEILRWVLDHEEGQPFLAAGAGLTVQVDGGPATLEGSLGKDCRFLPLTDTQDKPLTFRQDVLEAVEERVHLVRPVGTGTITLYVRRTA